jgi:hypothetical protein
MPTFELTRFVTSLQKRCFRVEAPDAATAEQRVQHGGSPGVVVGREAVLFKTQLDCQEVAATAAPANLKAATDQDGCPVWVPA